MELSDVFLFIEIFNPEKIIDFKDSILKGFTSIDEYFEYPKYSQETIFETNSFDEMLQFIVRKPGKSYTFYFDNDSNPNIKQAIIQINKDGSICLALSVEATKEKYAIQKLKEKYPDYPIFISNNILLPSSIDSMRSI